MATLYNNGSGNQSMGNPGAEMAAAQAAWQKAQLEGDPQAGKRASENYQKAATLQADPNRDVARAEKVGKENSDREIDKQQEKNRKDQEEQATKFNKLPAYENIQTKDVNLNTDNKLLKEYGNNYFELITYDQGLNNSKLGGQLKLAGVLKDMPSFSMSCTWDKGPASSISDTVKNLMCSPLLEMMTTMGGRDRSWMSLDEGTDRVYKTTSRPSFTLNFKLYSNEVIGSEKLTEWKTWLKALSLYTMPSVDAKVSINAMANNTLNGFYGCGDLIKNTFDSFQKGFSNAFDSEKNEAASDKSLIDKITKGIGGGLETAVNGVAGQLTERDGLNRVTNSSNTKNYYGAKLWYLRLLPGIFKKPLIVYISNWGVTYSKEINPVTHEPIWVEFTVTCEMDQIASAPVWMSYITGYSENIETYTKEYAKANKKN